MPKFGFSGYLNFLYYLLSYSHRRPLQEEDRDKKTTVLFFGPSSSSAWRIPPIPYQPPDSQLLRTGPRTQFGPFLEKIWDGN